MLLLAAAAVRRFFPRPSAGGNTTTLRTIYDGANAWADFGNTNVLQTRYHFTRAMDEVLARLSSTSILAWDLPDLLGSVRDISDGPGTAVIDHIKYDSYGNILAETAPSSGDRFKYTAREWDTATSQYFYRARYYTASAGRFTSQDPLGFGGSDANMSRYVNIIPVSYVDSTGFGITRPAIWIVEIIKGKRVVKTKEAVSSIDEAIIHARNGQDIIAPGQRAVAREIAKGASDPGMTPMHHTEHGRPHYHPWPKTGSHIFYSVVSAGAISTYAEGSPPIVKLGAEVADFFNPLAIPKDIYDLLGLAPDSEDGDESDRGSNPYAILRRLSFSEIVEDQLRLEEGERKRTRLIAEASATAIAHGLMTAPSE